MRIATRWFNYQGSNAESSAAQKRDPELSNKTFFTLILINLTVIQSTTYAKFDEMALRKNLWIDHNIDYAEGKVRNHQLILDQQRL